MRLSSEARIREEERLQRAIETEERRRRKKAERQEQDRVARKESDGKAKEEAERREKEMSERAKREEEERTERRNRLEMIMKRVKTDTPTTTPERARNPDVVELFVGGTHRYTTLRATVTQAKAGDLAEMFLGKEPLRVMKDGAYFLDTDGESFKLIIEYLRDGRLPDMDADSMKGTLRSEELLLKSSQTARKYGLLEYLHEIDQYGPIQRFKELEANKDIVEFYCKQILWALNKNDLEQNGKFAILLKSTNSTQIAASCCEHVCQFAPVDTVVHLTRKFSLQILRVLCQRLRFLGYNVAANEESCLFKCSKHEDGDTDKKECASRRHLLMWFVWLKKCSNPHE